MSVWLVHHLPVVLEEGIGVDSKYGSERPFSSLPLLKPKDVLHERTFSGAASTSKSMSFVVRAPPWTMTAKPLADAGPRFDVQVRVGLHTGECRLDEHSASGMPVDLAAAIACQAASGEVLVSRTVRDILGDAGLPFDDRGVHAMASLGEWRLYRV